MSKKTIATDPGVIQQYQTTSSAAGRAAPGFTLYWSLLPKIYATKGCILWSTDIAMKMDLLTMYFLLKIGTFHCYVSLLYQTVAMCSASFS